MIWFALDVTLQPEAREAVEFALMEAGALGTETGSTRADGTSLSTGYFDSVPDRELIRACLQEALRIYALPSASVTDMTVREVEDRDWLAEWKLGWKPVKVGTRLIVAPPWSELDQSDPACVVRIEPGMAFGTGTHETTRLCLQALETKFSGETLLDVGTGTGILAIAAVKLFPHVMVTACDTDADAIRIANENAVLNEVNERIEFRVGSLELVSAMRFDLVVANLTADVIAPLLPQLIGVAAGPVILSGILATQANAICSRLEQLGVSDPEVVTDGEWVSIMFIGG